MTASGSHEPAASGPGWNGPAASQRAAGRRRVLLALGSNVAPESHLPWAVDELADLGVVGARSRVWESAPVGYADQPRFLNAAVRLETSLAPRELRAALRRLEARLGRVRDPENRNGPRTIDLDIALYEEFVPEMDERSDVAPDPELSRRSFLATPLAELAPRLVVPELGKSLEELARELGAADLSPRDDVCLAPPRYLPHDCARVSYRAGAELSPPTLELRFCYGHRLLRYAGKCRRLHGHSARVELTLERSPSRERLDEQARRLEAWAGARLAGRMILCQEDPAIGPLRRLGEPLHLLTGNPTSEQLARLLLERSHELGIAACRSRIWESPRCSATYEESPQSAPTTQEKLG